MRLTIVGCTGSMSGPDSPASSYLVQAEGTDHDGVSRTWSIVLDLGPGAFGHLMRYVDPGEVDAVVLSHLHADHMSDMISMHVYRRWFPDGPLGPVEVMAPAGAVDRVRGVGGDGPEEFYGGEFSFHRHVEGQPWQVGPFTIESFLVTHPVEAYAVRITGPSENGGQAVLAFSGDSDACDGLVNAAKDSDLFLCEAAFVDGRDETRGIHLTGTRAGEVAKAAGCRKLLLTHIQPWTPIEDVLEPARTAFGGLVEVASSAVVHHI